MSNLINVPKNGGLTSTNSPINFPSWSRVIDDMFNLDLPTVFTSNFNTGITLPKVNIKETPESFLVYMAAPGLDKSNFQVEIDNHSLTISAEIKEEEETNNQHYTRREFGYSSFKRTFTLPETVNDASIDAKYTNGILHITLPKKEEAKQKPARTINIS
ncbi:Hsp20/alpha crystallin family protein [Cellulophaga lytica]|uniref:Heat shock protein Hsp20 n=1 Tax=Cellulophaga lytica (strain ATCC 23178 / DSM 7489 / JCM 8516 / NBRC 14961 / NCIMB 1423 / VKM B-1433 / Cy l20) TaxID=867900 RepID=F0RBM9_CELLC|nr:Hsp20/alpha crystallin family protein [Cellulophaga lytica]ADY30679.1 heat shock protein Hsp20 [Cellulophaga lytica DSM 7489]AIM61661.1 heat-shock protein [Cellulophaga lytica]MDO6853072.1 Hsp20/alpha crystallin family protein [Cellulophaga lytica]WQG78395.1 Hsp20/alpha crystallin family protein [Cellulophaga lytica]